VARRNIFKSQTQDCKEILVCIEDVHSCFSADLLNLQKSLLKTQNSTILLSQYRNEYSLVTNGNQFLESISELSSGIIQHVSPLQERVRLGPASPSHGNVNPFLGGSSSSSGAVSIFGGSSSNSVQPAPMFGGATLPQTSSSVFGGGAGGAQSNPFRGGNPQPSPLFGGGSSAQNMNPFMGGAGSAGQAVNQPSPFASSSLSASPFNAATFGGSTFGFGASPAPQGSIFGGGAASVFGGQPSSVFQAAPPEGGGGAAPAIKSFSFAAAAMGTPQLQSLVASPSAPQAAVAQTSVAAARVPASNPFSSAAPPASSAPSQPDSGVHSPLNELTEQEKAAFMAPTFSKGCIPLRPPPLQLCS